MAEEVAVHRLHEVELLALEFAREIGIADVGELRVAAFLALRADARALIDGGKKCRAVILRTELNRRGDGDEAGEVFIFRTEAVERPRAEAGADELRAARVHLDVRLRMIRDVGRHAAQHADVVGVLGDICEDLGDPLPALAVLREFERRCEQLSFFAGLAAVGLELRLVVERVHVRRAALHREEDDALRLRGEMRRSHRERRPARGIRVACEALEREPAEAGGDGFENVTPRQ